MENVALRTRVTSEGYQILDRASPKGTQGPAASRKAPEWEHNISSFGSLTFSGTSNNHIVNKQDVPVRPCGLLLGGAVIVLVWPCPTYLFPFPTNKTGAAHI